MSKLIAKGKVKRAEREHEAELQKDAEKRADKMLAEATPLKRKDRASNSDVGSGEIKNVIADSLERLWDELKMTRKEFTGEEAIRANAEEAGRYIAGSLMYGMHGHGGPVKIREAESTPRYCKEHR